MKPIAVRQLMQPRGPTRQCEPLAVRAQRRLQGRPISKDDDRIFRCPLSSEIIHFNSAGDGHYSAGRVAIAKEIPVIVLPFMDTDAFRKGCIPFSIAREN